MVDLQEATRRDDVYKELEDIRLKITALPVFPSLMWLWTYDIIVDIYTNYQTPNEFQDMTVPEGITLKQVFDKFWEDADKLGLNMDLGGEVIEETIRDWMIDNNFLVALDEDTWLDDSEEE